MLLINEIEYGLIPFGPGIGQRAISVSFTENKKESMKNDNSLYDTFRTKIKKNKLEQKYINAINGTQETFLIFKGANCIANIHEEQWQNFFIAISKEAVEVQKILKLLPNQLRPPYCIWVGTPKEFSSKRENVGEVFQYFNNCLAIIKDNNKNDLGLQQLINHQFSSICVIVSVEPDKDLVQTLVKKFNLIRKLSIIDNMTIQADIDEFCLEKGYRYYKNITGSKFLDLIKE